MSDEFTERRKADVMKAFKKAAKDLIELDAIPFAAFSTEVTARGGVYVVSVKRVAE